MAYEAIQEFLEEWSGENDEPEKQCSECDEWKVLMEFHKDKRKSDGLDSWCKVCKAIARESERERELKEDILDFMFIHERKHHIYYPDDWWLRYRRVLVDWMCEGGEVFHLHLSTVHLSVSLLDRFLHSTRIMRRDLQKVAIACILIAAKFEEKEKDVPAYSDIHKYSNWFFNDKEIVQTERMVLNKLNWIIQRYTTLHFCHIYYYCIMWKDDKMTEQPISINFMKKVLSHLKRYIEFFSDLLLQDYNFCKFRNYEVAAGIIYCSRRALNITPLWHTEYKTLFRMKETDVVEVAKEIWDLYIYNFPSAQST